jgi:hypothetical protein
MRTQFILVSAFAAIRFAGAADVGVGVSGDNVTINSHANVGTSASPGDLTVTGLTGSGVTIPALKVTGDGGFYFPAGSNTTLPPAVSSGSGFFYYPAKSALRLGAFYSITNASVGSNSIAFGGGTASGQQSFSSGGTASGYLSTALGNSTASNQYALAVGGYSSASGNTAVAMGYGATASGNYSFSFGGMALGDNSTAFGGGTATGVSSVVFGAGSGSYAQAAYSVVMGRNNVMEGDPATWVTTDPLFVVGNGTGTSPSLRSNAFVVYKNGDIKIPKAQGDIIMGEFGN